jgi:hypothetical protein
MALFIYLSQIVLFGQIDVTTDSALNQYLEQVKNIVRNSDSKLKDVFARKEYATGNISNRDLKILALEEYIKSLSTNDLLSVVKKRERIQEQDLYRLEEYIKHNLYINFNDQEGNYVKFGVFEKMIDNRITGLYGIAIKELIINPVLLKVKIIDRKSESVMVSESRSIGRTIITAEIQDIVKGEKHYKIGDNIKFYYMNFWARGSKVKLTDNDSYFVTLFPVENKNGDKLLGLNINEGLLKISQNIILDENNYYGFGKISWSDFKRRIIDKINIDKLMESAHEN